MPHGFKKKKTKRKKNPNEMPLNTKSLFFVYSDFKTETAKKTRRHLNIPLEPTVIYDEYVDEVVLRLRIEQKALKVWFGKTHCICKSESETISRCIYGGAYEYEEQTMHHQIEAKSKLKKCSSPSLANNKKGRVETIQHQQKNN